MSIRKFEEDINKMRTFIKSPTGEYPDEIDIFINNFIIRFRELIRLLSPANQQEFEKVAQDYKKNLKNFIIKSQILLELVKPIYNKKMIKATRWKAWKG